jgi:hypothetical protein
VIFTGQFDAYANLFAAASFPGNKLQSEKPLPSPFMPFYLSPSME